MGSILSTFAQLYVGQDQYVAAEPLLKRSLAISEKALGPDHLGVAVALNNLTSVFQSQDRYAEAEPLLKRALAIGELAVRPEHPAVGSFLATNALACIGSNAATH